MGTCLVVDPDRPQRDAIRAAAQAERFAVLEADDAEQALVVLEKHPEVRMLIVTCQMPGMDAPTLSERARVQTGDQSLYVLLIASSEVVAAAQGVWPGRVDGLLVRPFDVVELRMHLRCALRLRETIEWLRLMEMQAQMALAYTESIVNTVREPLLVIDRAFRVRSANQSFYRTFGLHPAGVTDTLLFDLGMGEWKDPRLRLLLDGVFLHNDVFDDFELQIGYRTLLVTACLMDGHSGWVLLAFHDVTAQRLALRTLRDSEESYRHQVEGAREHGIVQLDSEGRVTRWSLGAGLLLGFSEADMQHNRLPTPEGVTGSDLEEARSSGSAVREGWYRRKDGSRVYLRSTLTTMLDAAGPVVGYISVLHDNTASHVQSLALATAYEKEHRISSALERSLLREMEQDQFLGLQVECFYRPSLDEARVGGDFYDVFKLGDALALVIGDASGKGLAAAERTVEVRYGLRAFLMEDPSPTTALSRVNRLLLRTRTDDCEFVVAVVALIWPQDGRVLLGVAGMEGPLLVSQVGTPWSPAPPGLPLGVLDEPGYECSERCMQPEDVLVFFTDGLTDVRRQGQLLGSTGVCGMVQGSLKDLDLRRVGETILEGVERYGPLQDDACLLLVRRKPD